MKGEKMDRIRWKTDQGSSSHLASLSLACLQSGATPADHQRNPDAPAPMSQWDKEIIIPITSLTIPRGCTGSAVGPLATMRLYAGSLIESLS